MASSVIDVPVGTSAFDLQRMMEFAQSGDVFRLAEGTYYFDRTIEIYQDGITLIGAGRDKTNIVMTNDDKFASMIQIGHRLHNPVVQSWTDLRDWAYQGDNRLTVWNASYLDVGDVIYISADNTQDFFDEIGDKQWKKDNPLRTIMAEITAINGNTIEIDTPLTFDFDPSLTTIEERWTVSDVRLSGFTLTGPYGAADPTTYKNNKDGAGKDGAGSAHTMIMAGGTRDLNISDVAIRDSISHGLTIAGSVDADISNVLIDGAHNKGENGNGYGIWIRDTYDSRFTELDIVDVRHAVLFASYTSASGNFVHVADTNRDINFHGGRDQFNTVVVDIMRSYDAHSNAPGKEIFFNDGEHYGAPTDSTVNTVLIRSLMAEIAESHEADAEARTEVRGQVIYTGISFDTVKFTEKDAFNSKDDFAYGGGGSDTIYGSEGDDSVDGGSGYDILVLPGLRKDYVITKLNGDLYLDRSNDTTWVRDVELFRFRDGKFTAAELLADAGVEKKEAKNPNEAVEDAGEIGPEDSEITIGIGGGGDTGGGGGGEFDTSGNSAATHLGWDKMDASWLESETGTDGWDRVWIGKSSKIDNTVEALSFEGAAHLIGVGSNNDNDITGNTGHNRIEGRAGDDDLVGKAGEDTLLGGNGNDDIDGGSDNDMIDGGKGNDTMEGGTGDDTFRASAGEDWIDGERGEADVILFLSKVEDVSVRMEDDDVYMFTHKDGVTYAEEVEIFAFEDAAYTRDQVDQWVATGRIPDTDPDDPLPIYDYP